jgi:hypothetical protein
VRCPGRSKLTRIMMRMLKLTSCVSWLLALSLCAQAQKPADNSCAKSPLLISLSKGTGASLLKDYGYDLQEPWVCSKIESPWAPRATILQFHKITAQSDDQTAFSVVKIPGLQCVWVIPTGAGMLEVAHMESDPHNIAAFNALLRLHQGPIDAAGWLDAGKLYMALLGQNKAIPIQREGDEIQRCDSTNECSVSFSDRSIITGEAYNKWTLTFIAPSKGQPAQLSDVEAETVRP